MADQETLDEFIRQMHAWSTAKIIQKALVLKKQNANFNYEQLKRIYNDYMQHEPYKNAIGTRIFRKIVHLHLGTRGSIPPIEPTVIGEIIDWLTCYQFPILYRDRSPENFHLLRDLFIWALLHNRQLLARSLWENFDKDFIAYGLMACLIMKRLSGKTAKRFGLANYSKTQMKSAKAFEYGSSFILSSCHMIKPDRAAFLIWRVRKQFGNQNMLRQSFSSKIHNFVGHDCVQSSLERAWYRKVSNKTPWYVIFFGVVLTYPVMQHFIKFRSIKNPIKIEKGRIDFTNHDQNKYKSRFKCECYDFYTAPIVKFFMHTVWYALFLVLFGILLITEKPPDRLSPTEISVWIWGLALWFEELRQFFVIKIRDIVHIQVDDEASWLTRRRSDVRKLRVLFRHKLREYRRSQWNKYDQIVFSVFLPVIPLRLVFLYFDDQFESSSVIYAIAWIFFSLRVLQKFYVNRTIGPKIETIKGMLSDLGFFALVFFVFIVSYGVATYALSFPTSQRSISDMYHNILHRPYYAIYQEFDFINEQFFSCLPYNESLQAPADTDQPRCSLFANIFSIMYAAIACLLLVNLLIASFNTTFQKVEGVSEKTWSFHRADVITEYIEKPVVPPPLNIIYHLGRFLYKVIKRQREFEDEEFENLMDTKNKDAGKLNEDLDTHEKEGMKQFINWRKENEQIMDTLLENDDWQVAEKNWKIIDFGMNKKQESQEEKLNEIDARLDNIFLWQNSFSKNPRDILSSFKEAEKSFDNGLRQCRNAISTVRDKMKSDLDDRFTHHEERNRDRHNRISSAISTIEEQLTRLTGSQTRHEESCRVALGSIKPTLATTDDRVSNMEGLLRQQGEITRGFLISSPSTEEIRLLNESIRSIQTTQQQQAEQMDQIMKMLSEHMATLQTT